MVEAECLPLKFIQHYLVVLVVEEAVSYNLHR
jgi:hypothetical protein